MILNIGEIGSRSLIVNQIKHGGVLIVDMMLNVPGTPWDKLGTVFDSKLVSSRSMIEKANLQYTCSAHRMSTDISERVSGYHAIYRDDNLNLLGVVNKHTPEIVQSVDSFRVLEPLLEQDKISVETVSEANGGAMIFGCFKISERFKIFDDDVDHYFVVINDRTKPDGKVTVLNTPVRVVCQNALSHALSQSVYKLRMPVFEDKAANWNISNQIFDSVQTAISRLTYTAQNMYEIKIDLSFINKVKDELFPYVGEPGENQMHLKENEKVDMMRETFQDCLDADNLDNYRGTAYYVYNALVDYAFHYFKNADKGYDISYRMNLLPGFGQGGDNEAAKIAKLLKMIRALK